METLHYLEAAIAAEASLEIIYDGGSHPGARRVIAPIRIRSGILQARCDAALRSYRIQQLTLAGELPPFRHYNGIQDLLLRAQREILHSGLLPEADRYHLILRTPEGKPSASLISSQGMWRFNAHPCSSFQVGCTALLLYLQSRDNTGE